MYVHTYPDARTYTDCMYTSYDVLRVHLIMKTLQLCGGVDQQHTAAYDASREVFLADEDLDNGVDAAAAALKPYTLAEVSGAVPQTPTCYVHREEENDR